MVALDMQHIRIIMKALGHLIRNVGLFILLEYLLNMERKIRSKLLPNAYMKCLVLGER